LIALATLLLGAVLFTLYLRAYRATHRGDHKAADRWLSLTAPLWAVAAVAQVVQDDALLAAICGAMTVTGLWAFSNYRYWDNDEEEPAEPEAERRPDVLDSHRGGEA
jgi:hypothetical protein